ncbi:MAG: hypothetical protein OJF51_003975 [Nitrospira sp.]|nr:MAG: hypothetical protein OJF51_003975 [Nitrospira sp.]
MASTYLGVVDRLGERAGRPARLRPSFQASSDKARWLPLSEEFLNCGLVSWWQPHEASTNTAWYFHIEPSPTFSPEKEHHDYYRVKGSPSQALELIDIPQAKDLEEARAYLLEEGLPVRSALSKKIVFRDRSGSLIGPLDLTIRDDRFFIDEKHLEAPLTVHRPDKDLCLVTLEHHQFLPLKGWQKKVGEVDFSPVMTFLKRVIRDLKDLDPSIFEKARLTDKLISSYCSAIEKTTLTFLQKQRLKRLNKLSQESLSSISLAEDAISDLRSLPMVKEELAKAGEEAAQSAIKKHRSVLDELEASRHVKAKQIVSLESRLEEVRREISSAESHVKETLGSFDQRLQQKFQDITRDASSFLADIAVLRAALGKPVKEIHSSETSRTITDSPDTTTLGPTEIIPSMYRALEQVGLAPKLATALLASWAAGFAPIMYGERSREAVEAFSGCLFGGRLCWGTLGPSLVSPLDLMKLPIVSSLGTGTIEDVAYVAKESKGLFLLVLDHINLCQLDSVLLPLLRSYAAIQGQLLSSRKSVSYACSSGSLPWNILLAGIIIDSPLALPMSREMWTHATFIDVSKTNSSIKMNATGQGDISAVSAVPRDLWANWVCSVEGGPSDAMLLATHMAKDLDLTGLSRRMVRQLASAIDKIDVISSEQLKAQLLAEIALIPSLLSRGLDPNTMLRNMPIDISEDKSVNRAMCLFEKWGISSTED